MKSLGCSSRNISAQTKVPKSTVNDIYRHALQNAFQKRNLLSTTPLAITAPPIEGPTMPEVRASHPAVPFPEPVPLIELLSRDCLNTNARSGRPPSLTVLEKKTFVNMAKRDFQSRRMRIIDLQREAGVGRVSQTTALKALHENGIKAYREDFKFILSTENKTVRKV